MDVVVKRFVELTGTEVYELLQLRAAIFVVEQDCAFLDPDGLDAAAWHVLGRRGGTLVAYARIEDSPDGGRIGRVVTSSSVRGMGLGHDIMRACLEVVGDESSWLHAQDHLRAFYAVHGFAAEGDVFPEDDIPHVLMRRPARPAADSE